MKDKPKYLTSIDFDIVRYYLCIIEQNIVRYIVRYIVRTCGANTSHDAHRSGMSHDILWYPPNARPDDPISVICVFDLSSRCPCDITKRCCCEMHSMYHDIIIARYLQPVVLGICGDISQDVAGCWGLETSGISRDNIVRQKVSRNILLVCHRPIISGGPVPTTHECRGG
jgi:hypothetical protein